MASVSFSVGETFSSFKELSDKLQNYQRENCVQFYKRDSRKIEKSAGRVTKTIKPELIYMSIRYKCIHGGKNYKSTTSGKRNAR